MSSLDLPEGTVLQGRYEIVHQVSRGGMGRIFMARDLRFKGQFRALKQFLPSQTLSPEQRDQAIAMFEREAGLLASLRHAHMPGVFDHFIEDGVPYLVMHFVEGETLAAQLARSPNGLPESEVLPWAGQLCDILAYLHSQNPPIIFRDLKPSNIMIDQSGSVQLIDFGIARLFQGNVARQSDTVIVGTPGYSPPEQYGQQGQTTPRSDVYALGATLYHLLTGINPAMMPFVFQPPHQVNPAISERTSQVIMKALENDPARRYATASDFKQSLFARDTLLSPPITAASQRRAGDYATVADVPPPGRYSPPPPRQPVQPVYQAPAYQPPPPPPAVVAAPPAPAPRRGGMRLAFGAIVGAAFVVAGLICVGVVLVTQFPDLLPAVFAAPTPVAQATLAASDTPSPTAEPPTSVPTVQGDNTSQVEATDTPLPIPETDTPAPSDTPTPTARSNFGQIVFVNGYQAASELYVVSDSGGTPQRLTNNACADTEPDWSLSGQIVWQSDCDGSMDIWVMNANGSGPVNLTATSGINERGADWSPDGQQIVFEVSDGTNDGELFLMDANGANRRSLGLAGRSPAWGPGGDKIAYMSHASGAWQIYIYSVDNGNTTALKCPSKDCRFPEWSPDGLGVVVNNLVAGDPEDLYYIEVATGNSRQLTSNGGTKSAAGRPAYSPDGRYIVYNFDDGGNTKGSAIYRMLADGSSPSLVADLAGDDYQPDWH